MTQQLGAKAVLTNNTGLIPGTHMVPHNNFLTHVTGI